MLGGGGIPGGSTGRKSLRAGTGGLGGGGGGAGGVGWLRFAKYSAALAHILPPTGGAAVLGLGAGAALGTILIIGVLLQKPSDRMGGAP